MRKNLLSNFFSPERRLQLLVASVAALFSFGGALVVWKAYTRSSGITKMDASRIRELRMQAQGRYREAE